MDIFVTRMVSIRVCFARSKIVPKIDKFPFFFSPNSPNLLNKSSQAFNISFNFIHIIVGRGAKTLKALVTSPPQKSTATTIPSGSTRKEIETMASNCGNGHICFGPVRFSNPWGHSAHQWTGFFLIFIGTVLGIYLLTTSSTSYSATKKASASATDSAPSSTKTSTPRKAKAESAAPSPAPVTGERRSNRIASKTPSK